MLGKRKIMQAKDTEGNLAELIGGETWVENILWIGKLPCGCLADGTMFVPMPDTFPELPLTELQIEQMEEIIKHECDRIEKDPPGGCPKCGWKKPEQKQVN